jgi:hypothetical protein
MHLPDEGTRFCDPRGSPDPESRPGRIFDDPGAGVANIGQGAQLKTKAPAPVLTGWGLVLANFILGAHTQSDSGEFVPVGCKN